MGHVASARRGGGAYSAGSGRLSIELPFVDSAHAASLSVLLLLPSVGRCQFVGWLIRWSVGPVRLSVHPSVGGEQLTSGAFFSSEWRRGNPLFGESALTTGQKEKRARRWPPFLRPLFFFFFFPSKRNGIVCPSLPPRLPARPRAFLSSASLSFASSLLLLLLSRDYVSSAAAANAVARACCKTHACTLS